jgi:hypothetical protein
MINDKDIASMARLIHTDAQEVKATVANALANGLDASIAIDRLTRVRKLESIARSLNSLVIPDRTVKLDPAQACSCNGDIELDLVPVIPHGGGDSRKFGQ